jgi:hypothetical protein
MLGAFHGMCFLGTMRAAVLQGPGGVDAPEVQSLPAVPEMLQTAYGSLTTGLDV